MNDEHISAAKDEFKRADHLIYVSLKYTRTCDVLKHVVERFINAHFNLFQYLLEKIKEEGRVTEIPQTPIQRANMVKEQFKHDQLIIDHVNIFLKLRQIEKAPFTRSQEFRRHVTMTSTLTDDEVVETTIDSVTEDFKKLRAFMDHVLEKYGGA